MKRQVQAEGVRQWYGDDLISLQSEPMKVLDKFFEDYGNMIISGCKVKGSSITSGLVGLSYEDEGGSIYKVCEFRGLDSVESWPVYLSLSKEVIDGKYASEQTKPIIEQYVAKPDYLQPDGICISINSNGQVFAYESDDTIETRMVTFEEIKNWNRSRAAAVSDVRGGVPSNVNTLNQLYNWVQANYLQKTLRSNSHVSTSTESVATSKAVNDAKTSVISTVRDGVAPAYNTFKKLYDYVVGNYILNSRVSDSHTSSSTNNIASSKAILDAKANVLSVIRNGVSTTYDTIKKLYDYIVNNYISNSRVSNLHTSQSTKNVASSKAVYDAKNSVISTVLGGEVTYNTLKKLYSYVVGNYVAKSSISSSHTSTSEINVASSKAVKEAKSSVISTVLGGESTYNTLKKLYNYVVGNYVAKSSISSSHTSTSTSTVASSKAVSDAKSSILSTIRGSISSTYNSLKKLYDYIGANFVSNSRVNNSYSSTSTTNVASSKAVYDGRNYAINTIRGSISSTYNSLKKLYDYIGANFVSNSRVSNSYSSTSTTNIASSRAVRDSIYHATNRTGFGVIDKWMKTYESQGRNETRCEAIKYTNGLVKLTFMCDEEPGDASGLDVNRVEVPVQFRPVVDVFFVCAGSVSGYDVSQGKLKLGINGKIENGFPTHAAIMYQAIMTPSELSDYYVM